jgi:hypothetical protein
MLGSISSSPWEAVKVVASAPLSTAPCSTPAAPAALQVSASSPIVEAGVIG